MIPCTGEGKESSVVAPVISLPRRTRTSHLGVNLEEITRVALSAAVDDHTLVVSSSLVLYCAVLCCAAQTSGGARSANLVHPRFSVGFP
ncbi:uncharacterized protein K489DRAFT_382935 [Dissoconium aciculare CBS 342.82]|uniref:Uncharacterized protein n=1 Tax=Dissoconium aciculare CBS 342.82 TaxID=1314786 RepID=A0A6J3LZW7_9PEZI|nr:uncharacterized protein K489DRAFT_382935 [Dissoconium aciculare CBS 342.82]KAF1820182.1 hypothetical protein K489DRAFT_382935 [Dissoconium aciculare CBS 342.82]